MTRYEKTGALMARAVLAVLALVCVAGLGHAVAADVKLTVTNPGQAKYASFPVTSGVPLAQDLGVKDVGRMALLDSRGKAVPAQFRLLSRWGRLDDANAPVRWVLIDFQTDLEPRGKASFTLRTDGGTPEAGGRMIQSGPQGIEVNTGALNFKISKKGFRMLEDVRAGALSLPGGQDGGLVIARKDKSFLSSLGDSEVVVEEDGPLRAVIRVRGDFKDAQGNVFIGGDARPKSRHSNGEPRSENLPLRYTARITVFKGQSFVKVETTLENTGNTIHTFFPVNDVFLDGFSAVQPLPAGERKALFSGQKKTVEAGAVLQLYKLVDKTDESKNFYRLETLAGKSSERQGRYPGWTVASVQGGEVMGFVKDFWERFPKSLEITPQSLVFGLLPDSPSIADEVCEYTNTYSTGRHYFSGGWHMTDGIWLDFRAGSAKLNPENQAACFASPLFALCEPRWFAQTEAWSKVAPAGFRIKDPAADKALCIYERMVSMPIDKSKSAQGKDLELMRETRSQDRTWYGWDNFGCLAHGGLFSSLIYDWPFIMWLQYARSGDERFREKALEMSAHSMDLDQIHGGRTDGTRHWEKQGPEFLCWHHKSTQNAGAMLSHTWNGGYVLEYLMTGNQRALESAAQSAGAAQRVFRKVLDGNVMKMNQTRHQGWSILTLVNLYRVTGDKTLLEQALRIFTGSLLYTEQLPNKPGSAGRGYITEEENSTGPNRGRAVATYQTYPLEPLCELHLEASRTGMDVSELEAYILRCLNFLKTKAIVGGESKGGKYSVHSISYGTDPDNPEINMGGQLHHNVLMSGPFAYASANLLKDDPAKAKEYFELARTLFEDVMFYGSVQKVTKVDFLDPGKIGDAKWPWFPVMPKVMGWIGRGSQMYLNQEYEKNSK